MSTQSDSESRKTDPAEAQSESVNSANQASQLQAEQLAAQPVQSPSAETVESAEAAAPEADAAESRSDSTSESAAKPVMEPAPGPLSLERIRQLRKGQQSPPIRVRKPSGKSSGAEGAATDSAKSKSSAAPPDSHKKDQRGDSQKTETGVIETPASGSAPKVHVPNRREVQPDLEDELSSVLGGSDLDSMLIGDEMLQVGRTLSEGQRLQAKVVKVHEDDVFLSLGGPDEGTVPITQFEEPPEIGAAVEVIIRGYSNDEGLYELTLPGNAVEVSDWADIREGEVIEVLITAANSGGLECKAGSLRGFIPASQVAEYRVENLGEMVDQKVLCVITEANERRGNLVLSRRAVLEREKEEKRAQRLASISVGDAVEGTVTKILDFGAFVDIGGLDGLLHISQLAWERVEHPSEILEVGQRIQVRIEKIDEQSGKIGLSYRSLQEHPWSKIDERFPVGSLVKGTVTRLAEFGAFVKVATGVEGLVHLSELAHHRVGKVSNVVQEGQEVEVKVLSIDEDKQRMSLSIKAAQAAPEGAAEETGDQEEEPRPKPVLPKREGPLKGGTGGSAGGEQFGLKW